MDGIIGVWISKKKLEDLDINKAIQKLLEITTAIKIPPDVFIYNICRFVEKKNLISKKYGKSAKVLTKEDCYKEGKICHFVYSYILYSVQHLFKNDNVNVANVWN